MRSLAIRDSRSIEVQTVAEALADPYMLDMWLRRNWHVVPDPPEAELVLSPATIIQCGWYAGDCDDVATFAASLLRAMGVLSQLVAIRVGSDTDFTHVFCRVPAYRLDIDPIVPAERIPIPYTEAMVMEV